MNWFPTLVNFIQTLGNVYVPPRMRPFVVEEFGFLQGSGDLTRAAEFQNMYNLGKQYGTAATVFWNLGPEISSSSYEVNPNTPFRWSTVKQNAPH